MTEETKKDELLDELAEMVMKCRMPINDDAKSMTNSVKLTDVVAGYILSREQQLTERIGEAVKILEEAKRRRPLVYYEIYSQVERKNCDAIYAALAELKGEK